MTAHDRADILKEVDLSGTGDDITQVLIEMTQWLSVARSDALAEAIVVALIDGDATMRKQANKSADFGVLKAPDIPSILIELGFMSDTEDLNNLADPLWRERTSRTIAEGLMSWQDAEETADLGRN